MIKKFSALALAVMMTVTALTGCSDSDSSSSAASSSADSTASTSDSTSTDSSSDSSTVPDAKLVIDGEEVDTTDLVLLTVDGRDVSFDMFRYYYYYTLNYFSENYGMDEDSFKEDEDSFNTLMEYVVMFIKQEFVTYTLCEENDITLSDEEIEENEETYNTNLESCGSEEEFEQTLHDSYMTPELYKTMLELASLYTKTEEELFTNEGVYATTKDEFREIVQDTSEYACVRSILIPYECKAEITDEDVLSEYDSYSLNEKYTAKQDAYDALDEDEQEELKEEAKELADTVYQKIQDGEDFEELLDEYNWDPGMESSTDGYYVTPDSSLVEEYLDAAFSIDVGETTEVIESTDYGYFIIKRNEVDMDYVEENIEDMIESYDLPARQELYNDTMDAMEVTYSDTYESITMDSIT